MIRPTKYLDLNTCILRISAKILGKLSEDKIIQIEELKKYLQYEIGSDAKYNFLSSLNLLFLAGKIDYKEASDSILFLD